MVEIQNVFLEELKKNQTNVTVFTTNGVQLRGTIQNFDKFCVVLSVNGKQQLLFKHAISTISPQTPVQIHQQK
ncbi:RNA-binding protein Hfq [Pontibacillus halophilus JSM 076056 = DSM 19796]|uniref:RNA-binding protein Hfq n=1 Tax=Pontibacillus halophilus JSM 076056 = DSM 19796 TaxID=1385510 RepID=A0A0A5I542_9BACI|nr:RNA chaperone Hfq [Pontibacillus halophilus]KGX90942.1 RNA-binding protein Hfq [Pontibacillus halophilus JSM 076056 = DSM 19796]